MSDVVTVLVVAERRKGKETTRARSEAKVDVTDAASSIVAFDAIEAEVLPLLGGAVSVVLGLSSTPPEATQVMPTQAQEEAFKIAWARADSDGLVGARVRAGLIAALNVR